MAGLATVRRRWFALVALRTVGHACLLAAIPVIVALGLDLLLQPQGFSLLVLAAGTAVASLSLAVAVVLRMPPRPDDRHVARFIEERAGALPGVAPLDDALVSAVEIAAAPQAPERAAFLPLVLDAGARRLQAIDPRRLIETAALRRAALSAAGGLAMLIVALVLAAPGLWRTLDMARVRYFPDSVNVQVLPGDARLPAGSPLHVRALVRGGERVLSRFPPSLVVSAGGETRAVEMTRATDGFEFAFESIDRTFTYRVSAGAARSSQYTVTAVSPPRVDRIDLRYEYPAFTGLPPREDEDGGDIYGPAGTRVRVRIHADKPIVDGALAMARGGAAPLALTQAGERVLEATFVLERDDAYRVRLADVDGLRSDDRTEYYIRLVDDRPPDVRILRPSADQSITPLEEVTIEARADDDYGIGRFELVYSVGGGSERAVPFQRADPEGILQVGTRVLAAEELGVKPGDVIAYYARAWDVGRGKRPTLAQSDIFFLEVKPFSEEFVMAESQAGEGGGAAGVPLESLIAAQKEIISATWNLERRAANGLSDADLQRVLEAQAELRARAQALAGGRGRGRGGAGPPVQRITQAAQRQGRAAADPVGDAIAAMSRAVTELEARRMRDAIQQEMEALNGLLAAQAEVRRREIMRQSGRGGGGGGSRSSQDLSALFDRELQRQQRTTYETRDRVQEDTGRQEQQAGAADRIRDLARRQEELSRQQRDLAASSAAEEERKRQLERLTREQADLREQAEQLLAQMRQGGAGGAGSGESGMQQASDRMRQATGELRKDDATSAARSGERAAEQLRRLEEQVRGSGQGAGQRSEGELRLEARQIAQEQNRIAAEAERLEGSRGDTKGARERLAGEKERLAWRVDELQRAAAGEGRREGAAAGKGAADAASALEQQKLADRMREGARQMREGSGAGVAEPERQLARALEDVAGRMEGQASSEAGRLSEQLADAGRTRDRLNRLEAQIREAEARGRHKPGQAGDLERLQAAYQRELERARHALGPLQGAAASGMGATPEGQQAVTSSAGTEGSKQDRSEWVSLRQGIDSAIGKQEAVLSERLARAIAKDRLSVGASERVPDAYQRLIARYYESIARLRR